MMIQALTIKLFDSQSSNYFWAPKMGDYKEKRLEHPE